MLQKTDEGFIKSYVSLYETISNIEPLYKKYSKDDLSWWHFSRIYRNYREWMKRLADKPSEFDIKNNPFKNGFEIEVLKVIPVTLKIVDIDKNEIIKEIKGEIHVEKVAGKEGKKYIDYLLVSPLTKYPEYVGGYSNGTYYGWADLERKKVNKVILTGEKSYRVIDELRKNNPDISIMRLDPKDTQLKIFTDRTLIRIVP